MKTTETMGKTETTEESKEKDKKYVVIREGGVSDVAWKVARFYYSRFIVVR